MLLDVKEAAAWLGLSPRDVWRRLQADTIPCRRIPSATNPADRVPRFHPDDLDAWTKTFRTGVVAEASESIEAGVSAARESTKQRKCRGANVLR